MCFIRLSPDPPANRLLPAWARAGTLSRPVAAAVAPTCERCGSRFRVMDGTVLCEGCPIPFRVVFDQPRSVNCHE